MKVEIYSDVACPWCYVGKRRFEQALETFERSAEVEVVFRPFQLEPDAPTTPRPLMRRLAEKFGPGAAAMAMRVTDAAAEDGIAMDFERALAANTFGAHRLLRLAEHEHGAEVQRAVAEGLFRAHFSEGGDIGDPAVLVGVAEAAGMPRERVRDYLATDEGATEVKAELDRGRELGITAVPTFVFDGRYAVQGAQPVETFAQALRSAFG